MKKNYFMLVCLVLLSAISANAQVNSVADLFGKYKFTADVEFASEDFKTSYGNTLLGESDVTIEADAQYAGRIVGFAGSQQKLNIRAIDGNTIEMTNFNNPQLWNGLFMANGNADHPNGVFDGEWVSYPYNTDYYEYNPETKVITVPTFTVVTVSGQTVTVVATYKNAKLTYVGGDDEEGTSAFEWAGTHTLTAANVTAYDGKEYPVSFDVTIVKDAEEYFVTNVMGYDVTGLNNGGIAFTVAADGKSAQMATGTYLYGAYPDFIVIQDMNASSAPINLVLQEDGSVKVDDIYLQGLNYDTNKTTPLAFYQDVTIAAAGGSEPEASAFNWVGQHTVKVGSIESYNDKSYPTEFTMTVIEGDESLLVTEFFSTDVTELNYGGIAFTVAEDGKSAEMKSASFVGGAHPDYLVIYDMNTQENPIRFVLNADGSVAIDNFCVKNYNFDTYEETLAALFKDVTIPAAGGEVVEPEEPETSAFDWAGTYTFSGTPGEGSGELPSTFEVVVTYYEANEYQDASYCITSFMGNDVNSINYGGIKLTIADDGKSATLANGNVQSYGGGNFLKLFDGNGTANPIAITLNDDGTLSMADFSLVSGAWGDNENNTFVGWYQNVTLTKGGEVVEPEEPETPAFDWAGTYTFNGTPNSMDDSEYPATFEVVVTYYEANEYQDASYCITSFMGNDVNSINYGGIELTIAEDGKSATLANGNVMSLGGGLFLKLFDVNATANPIAITLNEDGTLSMADFSVVMGPWDDNDNNTLVAWYQNAVLTKGGEVVEPEEPAGPQYRVKCDNGYLNVYSTYAYPTGPIGGVNVVEYAEDNNQIFTIEDAGNGNVYLKSVSGYYIYCQSWNVDGLADNKSALTFEETADGKFYIKCANGYFKVEYVSSTPVATIDGVKVDQPAVNGYFPYCDALIAAAALWSLEEVGGSTGIENVEGESGNVKGIYDLTGRRVEEITAPGIYVVNGKKVLVK